ncbi:phosphate ABC transporter permease subunit PstC [Ignavibacteria bacterium CHB1]|nr:MAG: phosphate ABC transporter permease subunit PstC [Chlorobiota bacterium]MBW7856330.1 phosphate ABC transporter permease subunit PstC [Ignavibacteria bacterium]MCC6885073.1 phosphate ABC transporter permease subunit PstC [Ignavibacteriales bacterium]MCE7952136.1 phosphate ABC transporter permease subunit PstC [Chlorobi bacterium CHB7]MDL1886307.1 phosphate ABC transporter permease subunit PstC [Ignavibacteria bacterium CHB1]RIK49494.1 MAG: phosphate ABC transporter permease subunit PstC 
MILGIVLWIIYEMYFYSGESRSAFGWEFIWSNEWEPVRKEFGALAFVYGTAVSSILALIIALPLSLGVAIFLSELAPKIIKSTLSFVIEILAAIPSIIFGFWGIFVLAPFMRSDLQPFLQKYFGYLPFFQGTPLGTGLLTAGIILAIMIIPIITAISRDVLKAIPQSQREAAYALGATKWEAIKMALLNAKSGILGATVLGFGRAVGETMAVTMVIGNRADINISFFEPAYTMASVIANEFAEASEILHLSSLIEVGLLLFGVTFLINSFARLLIFSVTRNAEGR